MKISSVYIHSFHALCAPLTILLTRRDHSRKYKRKRKIKVNLKTKRERKQWRRRNNKFRRAEKSCKPFLSITHSHIQPHTYTECFLSSPLNCESRRVTKEVKTNRGTKRKPTDARGLIQ